LLGTTYGGDGKSNFALPNMQGNAPMHPGQGPGLSLHDLGETGGTDTVTLLQSEIPSHTHMLQAFDDVGEDRIPSASEALARSTGGMLYAAPGAPVSMQNQSLAPAGGGQPHNNMQPYLTLNFCIALQGIYPSRS
jgi:microcystin-dependent protein